MVTAIVLLKVERNGIESVAQALLSFAGVTEVFSVAGQYDLVAILRTHTNEEIADLMTKSIRGVSRILQTETLMAFKAYSRDDLGKMFSIGNEEATG